MVAPVVAAPARAIEVRRDAARPAGGNGGAALLIPVSGIAREQLLDTFTQARGGGRVHNAIDIIAPRGTPVIAVVDGTVRKLFNSRAGGLSIYQFDDKEERVYYYAHLDRYADGLLEGARITAGTVIGYVGTTGNASADTPHLHFAVEVLPPTKEWWKGVAVNPYPLLTTPSSALR
jgi:peptidoglycan LD-endopeptidase LytH